MSMRDLEPTGPVYIVVSEWGSYDNLMVFADEGEAERFKERHGWAMVLEGEPVFTTAEHCEQWCDCPPICEEVEQ